MSSIYNNGNKWYYQNSINIDGRKQRFQRSLGTDDKDVATKLQMHYDYVIEYEKRKKEIEFTYVFENPVGQIPHHHFVANLN